MSANIDQIFYINLDSRTDKRDLIESQLNALGVQYERFPAIYQPKNGVGCTKSHLAIFHLAKARGYRRIMILEDDFVFGITKEVFESRLEKLFSAASPPVFDVCFISNTTVAEDEAVPDCDFLRRAIDVYGAEGYIVNGHYYDTLIDTYEKAVPLLEQTGAHWLYISDRAWLPLLRKDYWMRFVERFGRQDREMPRDNN
jgi:GR25 family glycosyltransferase involved in LPS biosynthesis